jgi:hypothetical protein
MKQKYYSPQHEEISKALDKLCWNLVESFEMTEEEAEVIDEKIYYAQNASTGLSELKKIWFNITKTNFNFTK